MGMYDSIYVEYNLPEITLENKKVSFSPDHEFQTKDLHCMLDSYLIADSGRLLYKEFNWLDKQTIKLSSYKDANFHGFLNFYTTYRDGDIVHYIDFIGKFTDGNVVTIDYSIS